MKLVVVLALVSIASALRWHAVYDMDQETYNEFAKQGCSRGQFGAAGKPARLSLVTCPFDADSFTTADDAFLCVAELTAGASVADALRAVSNDTHVHYVGQNEIVLGQKGDQSVRPDMCSRTSFPAGIVDNTPLVSTSPVYPQPPRNTEHPAMQRLDAGMLKGNLEAKPIIERLLLDYKEEQVDKFMEAIALDNEGQSVRVTRNSYAIEVGRGGCQPGWVCADHSVDIVVAEINEMFKDYHGDWEVETKSFRNDMCHNVILKMHGEVTPEDIVVSGAHLDSRNTGSGSTASGPAPGADDNASGSAVLLEMARVIAENNVEFTYSVHFLWFCGEEQGLLGSRALANEYRDEGTTIIGMFNNDMIGYTSPTHGVTLSFMDRSATTWLSEACMAFTELYVEDLPSAFTGACCSDQQSFFNAGFPAAGIFETPTNSVVYPQYHREGDALGNGLLNHEQIWQFGLANFACMMEFAVPIDE